MQGNNYQLDKEPLVNISIKEISSEEQKPLIGLANKILSITKDDDYLDNQNKQLKVKLLEKEIDELVYELYELTTKEIRIVEDFNKESLFILNKLQYL